MASNLGAAFAALPEKIRDWLGSDEVTDLIAGINDDFGIVGEKKSIIPRVVLRLAVQNLEPRDFINELSSRLGIDYRRAKEIARRVYDNVLKPIETLLKNIGVNVGLVVEYARGEGSSFGFLKRKEAKLRDGDHKPLPPDNLPTFKPPVKPASPDKPLILYREEGAAAKVPLNNKPSFKYRPFLEDEEIDSDSPPPAEVETLSSPRAAKIVHYSNFITPLNQSLVPPKKKLRSIPIPKSRWFIN